VVPTGVDCRRTSLRGGAYAAGPARRQGARLVVAYVRSGFARVPFAGLVREAAASVDAAGREVGQGAGPADPVGSAARAMPNAEALRCGRTGLS
jgi:hypothetical protein